MLSNQTISFIRSRNIAPNALLVGHETYVELKAHRDSHLHFGLRLKTGKPDTIDGLQVIRVDAPRMLEIAFVPGLPA